MGSSSLTRDQTRAPWIGSRKFYPLDHHASPSLRHLKGALHPLSCCRAPLASTLITCFFSEATAIIKNAAFNWTHWIKKKCWSILWVWPNWLCHEVSSSSRPLPGPQFPWLDKKEWDAMVWGPLPMQSGGRAWPTRGTALVIPVQSRTFQNLGCHRLLSWNHSKWKPTPQAHTLLTVDTRRNWWHCQQGVSSQGCGFSSSHKWMWEMDH